MFSLSIEIKSGFQFHKCKIFRANMAENVTRVYDVTLQMGGAFEYTVLVGQRGQALSLKTT